MKLTLFLLSLSLVLPSFASAQVPTAKPLIEGQRHHDLILKVGDTLKLSARHVQSLKVDDVSLVRTSISPTSSSTIVLTGLAPGYATCTVTSSRKTKKLVIWVQP